MVPCVRRNVSEAFLSAFGTCVVKSGTCGQWDLPEGVFEALWTLQAGQQLLGEARKRDSRRCHGGLSRLGSYLEISQGEVGSSGWEVMFPES